MNNEKFYVLYLDLRGNSPERAKRKVKEMEDVINSSLKRPGDRWLILPAEKTDLVCIDPIILKGKEASNFIETFNETRNKIYTKLGLDKTK